MSTLKLKSRKNDGKSEHFQQKLNELESCEQCVLEDVSLTNAMMGMIGEVVKQNKRLKRLYFTHRTLASVSVSALDEFFRVCVYFVNLISHPFLLHNFLFTYSPLLSPEFYFFALFSLNLMEYYLITNSFLLFIS
jgi:hypothetical protein